MSILAVAAVAGSALLTLRAVDRTKQAAAHVDAAIHVPLHHLSEATAANESGQSA